MTNAKKNQVWLVQDPLPTSDFSDIIISVTPREFELLVAGLRSFSRELQNPAFHATEDSALQDAISRVDRAKAQLDRLSVALFDRRDRAGGDSGVRAIQIGDFVITVVRESSSPHYGYMLIHNTADEAGGGAVREDWKIGRSGDDGDASVLSVSGSCLPHEALRDLANAMGADTFQHV